MTSTSTLLSLKNKVNTAESSIDFRVVLTKKEAANIAVAGKLMLFYPKPSLDESIMSKIPLTGVYKDENREASFCTLDVDEIGWHIVEAASPRPSFDTLPKLLDYYSTYMFKDTKTSEFRPLYQSLPRSSVSVNTIFEGSQ
ncbi:unnamed protein product [Caenorhabditis auriculariae]|uniref:SH2 domain-containing protein n=1 Tax=Caenorhabditis auriculariae TaxID=2777116 RepID=A0A8S1GZ21_9PELO|nr:unnamed protein product [Caenorhabditis auriculariae]